MFKRLEGGRVLILGERQLLVVEANSQEGFLLPILTLQQNYHVFLEVVNNEAFFV